jgi:hypothetical protein
VVEQTEEVHEQIADLLEQLRRFQDVQVLLETEIVRAPEDVIRRLGYHFVSGDYAPLTPDRARMFREGIRISDHASARRLPKAALFDGQLAQVAVSPQPDDQSAGAGKLSLQAVIDHDRRRVRLTFAGDGGDGKSATAGRTTIVEAGHSLLLDVTGQSGTAGGPTGVPFLRQVPHVARLFGEAPAAASTERTLVLVTPTIVIQEEEEERLGLAPK